ncbi:MAG: energy transducer TonB [Inhella sp.]
MSTTFTPSLPGWKPAPLNRHAVLAVLVLHIAAIALLLQAGKQVVKRLQPSPVEVAVLQEAPPVPPSPAPLPMPRITLPQPQLITLPLPEIVSSQAVREGTAISEPPTAPPAAPRVDSAPPAVAIAPPAPAPKPVSATSLRWQVEPAVEVPRLSRRAGEQGRVQLAVIFDAEGRPASVQLLRGSGFARLDAQAMEAIRVARITPYVEDGRVMPVSTVVNIEYELG